MCRHRRQALDATTRQHAAKQVQHHWQQYLTIQPSDRIASYIPMAEEIDVRPLNQALSAHATVAYPVLHPYRPRHLWMLTPQAGWVKNAFGIDEPYFETSEQLIAPWELDYVIVPLVAVNADGMRLGMGGGFYDTTFAFKANNPHIGPQLIGIAYDCQMVDTFDVALWDIGLDTLITPTGVQELTQS